MKWLVVLCLLASPAAASTGWIITTSTGDTVAIDATRTATGYRASLHTRTFLWEHMWTAIPCPGDGEQSAGETLLELDRQSDGTFNVKLYKGRLYTTGPEGLGGELVGACVFDSPLLYKGVLANRATAAAVDANQVGRYPRDDDSFLVLTYNSPPCPVPDTAKRTCGGIWPFKPIIDMPMVDTDGDGINDEWEAGGIRDGTNWLDLKSMGADPDHKDLFVQLDSTSETAFPIDALLGIQDTFAHLPISNPDGHDGVALHLDAGPNSLMTSTQVWGAAKSRANLSASISDPFTSFTSGHACDSVPPDIAPLTALMTHNLDRLRAKVFRYAVAIKYLLADHTCASGMNWTIPSKAFAVGTWGDHSIVNPSVLVGVFLHELGHSLGLRHAGGTDEPNYKPNYQSVMNYAYQVSGIWARGQASGYGDYHYSAVNPTSANAIDEAHLADHDGFPDVGLAGMALTYKCATGVPTMPAGLHSATPRAPTDLQCNGDATSPAPIDVTPTDGGTPATLTTFNDVTHLHLALDAGGTGAGGGASLVRDRSLHDALAEYGALVGDKQAPTVKASLRKKGKKRQLTIKAHDDVGLASALVTVAGVNHVVMLGKIDKKKKAKLVKDATETIDLDEAGDVTVVVTDISDKSATTTAK